MVNFNVTRLGFAFVLISFDHMNGAVVVPQFVGEGGGGYLELDVQGQGGRKKIFGRKWTVGWGS